MIDNFLGQKYILKKSENFDAYMKELGVGLTLRKMGNTLVSQCELQRNDDNIYTFTLETPYHSCSINFEMNKEFTEITLDNRVVKTICHLEDNVFVQKQQAEGLKATKIIREYTDNELTTTLTVGDVKAVRIYGILEESEESEESEDTDSE
ncbi:probable fatty acid-binding protein [Lucilia sericata]|uniref:probable fatty acid-binding protein n=1 Tax=Lucilia sericata TaxID=13632 RepID=UPI0018A85E36|nr:probable fatty acid-binding protein [Lucilia sericata]